MAASPKPGPPRARIAFRVGVVGHRPNRLPADKAGLDAIQGRLTTALQAARAAVETFRTAPDASFYTPEPAALLAVSPLADGADRMFARAALDESYGLCAPMPFPRAEYEKDFIGEGESADTAPGVVDFRSILQRASGAAGLTTFELDGVRHEAAEAYGAAGRIVLNQSDLLVVVWDGEPARGGGGTVETLREAVRFHVPVLWIDAEAPHGWTMLREASDLACLTRGARCAPPWTPTLDPEEDRARLAEAVSAIVTAELSLPEGFSGAPAHDGAKDKVAETPRGQAGEYFAERRPAMSPHWLWKAFRNLVGDGRLTPPRLILDDFVGSIAAEWPVAADEQGPVAKVTSQVNMALRVHYAWADKLADLYADAHRSSFIAGSLYAAMAVAAALLPVTLRLEDHPVAELVFIAVEGGVLVLLGLTYYRARVRRYHEKWLEYRLLAEWIRQLRFLIPLGGGRPLPRTPEHLAVYGEPTRSWMYWQMRAIARAVGLPTACASPAYIAECIDYLSATVASQIAFHQTTMARSARIRHRLHLGASMLVAATITGVAVHFVLRAWPGLTPTRPADPWLAVILLISAWFPALGAALANINNQGEFARLAKRSRAMKEAFLRLQAQIETMRARLQDGAVSMAQATTLADHMAKTMVDEVVDWRIVVLDPPHAG